MNDQPVYRHVQWIPLWQALLVATLVPAMLGYLDYATHPVEPFFGFFSIVVVVLVVVGIAIFGTLVIEVTATEVSWGYGRAMLFGKTVARADVQSATTVGPSFVDRIAWALRFRYWAVDYSPAVVIRTRDGHDYYLGSNDAETLRSVIS